MTALGLDFAHVDSERPSGVYPRIELDEETIALLRALYGLASEALTRRALACSVLIREVADEVAAGGAVSVDRLARLREMGGQEAALAVRIIEGGRSER